MTTSTTNTRIQDRVVLLLLNFHGIGNDRAVKDKSILKTDANTARLRTSKRLIECPEYDRIGILDGQAQAWVKAIALPSPFKTGTHVIPLSLIETVDKGLQTFLDKRRMLVEELALVYEDATNQARAELGELFNPDDYMSLDELRRKYRMEWQYVTLQPPSQMEELSAEIYERERERLQKQWDESIDTMKQALEAGLSELVNDMVTRLGSDKTFKPTKLLQRFDDFLSTFDARNITNDGDLALLASKARGLLAGVTTENLLESQDLRDQIKAGFTEAQVKLGELETKRKSQRQITFTDE